MAAIVPALSAVSLAGLLFTVARTALRGLTLLAGRLASIAVTDTGYILQYTSQSTRQFIEIFSKWFLISDD